LEEIQTVDDLEEERELAQMREIGRKRLNMIWQKWPLCKKSVGGRNLLGLKKETTTRGSFIVLLILIEDTILSLAYASMAMSLPR
jgi:hypothetical protein